MKKLILFLIIFTLILLSGCGEYKKLEKIKTTDYFSGITCEIPLEYNRITIIFSSLDNMIGVLFQVATILVCVTQIYANKMTIVQFTILNTCFALLIEGVKYYLQLGKSYQSVKVSWKVVLL